jgi:diguanylate cyclase (GGDEF)-like protein
MILRWVAKTTHNRGFHVRLVLFAVTAVLVIGNALRPAGVAASIWGDAILQSAACLSVVVCGLVVACRVTGPARTWRLLVVVAVVCWLSAQAVWWWHALVRHSPQPPPLPSTVGYFAFLLLALAGLLALTWSGRPAERGGDRRGWTGHNLAVLAIDGLVATVSFAILVWSAGGRSGGFHLPPSGGRPESVLYSVVCLIVVVAALVVAISYAPDRRYRANLLLLAAGLSIIVGSDRLIAYLGGAGMVTGQLWARSGFVVGPLLIACAVLQLRSGPESERSGRVMAWSQLLLPYIGAVFVSVLIGFHTYVGLPVDLVQVSLGILVMALLVVRQVVSLRENHRLLRTVLIGQRRLIHQIHHDALTGLPNRQLFAERLDAAIAAGEPFTLIYIDLDDFKDVNDQYGHAAGDRLLRSVGHRLSGCAHPDDTVARIGGDEFGILVRDDGCTPEGFADRYRAALRPPFALHGQSVRVRASMGLVAPDALATRVSADEFLRRADASMYEGKRRGKDSTVVYHSSALLDFPTALRLAESDLPPGFRIVYQPIVSLPDGNPVALEALARWTAPNGTQISPESFVATAEAAGLGAWFDILVLDTVCSEIASAGIDLVVHVNMGAGRLGDRAFERSVAQTIRSHGLPTSQVVLEITESVPIVDLADGAAAIQRLQADGLRVALDDFGAGYNTLTYLHALPVDIVKLDRGLAIGIEPGHDAVLYRSVVGICEQLGLEVVAEGVETAAQADTIHSAGCVAAQGYRFGRPVPIAEVPSLSDQPITSVNAAR